MAVIYPKQSTATAAAGTFSVTIPATAGICKQIFVQSTTATTTFDVTLTDIFSLEVVVSTDSTGLYNQLMELPCYGGWTLTISNASVDELFNYLVVVQEF